MDVFEFTVDGPPLSHQTHNRAALRKWRNKVRAAAALRWEKKPPLTGPLRLALTYFHLGEEVVLDVDNMVKPILDALIGLIYADDRQLTDVAIRKSQIKGLYVAWGAPSVLLQAMSCGEAFVYATVGPAPPHSIFLR